MVFLFSKETMAHCVDGLPLSVVDMGLPTCEVMRLNRLLDDGERMAQKYVDVGEKYHAVMLDTAKTLARYKRPSSRARSRKLSAKLIRSWRLIRTLVRKFDLFIPLEAKMDEILMENEKIIEKSKEIQGKILGQMAEMDRLEMAEIDELAKKIQGEIEEILTKLRH